MSYTIKPEDALKLSAIVWLKSTAEKQDIPAPYFKQGTQVFTTKEHKDKHIVLSTLGAYALIQDAKTEKTAIVSVFDLQLWTENKPIMSVGSMLNNGFNVRNKQ